MSKTESIHVGFVSEYNQNQATIHVAGKDYYVSLTEEESNFLEDIIFNVQLSYIAFDIANKRIITYDIFRPAEEDETKTKDLYVAFIKMFKG